MIEGISLKKTLSFRSMYLNTTFIHVKLYLISSDTPKSFNKSTAKISLMSSSLKLTIVPFLIYPMLGVDILGVS